MPLETTVRVCTSYARAYARSYPQRSHSCRTLRSLSVGARQMSRVIGVARIVRFAYTSSLNKPVHLSNTYRQFAPLITMRASDSSNVTDSPISSPASMSSTW